MKSFGLASAAAAVIGGAALFAASVNAADVDPIVIKGQHFFYKTNGTEFFIRGVAYQQEVVGNGSSSADATFTDPLSNTANCDRDVPILEELGTNVIRVYAIDPTADHDYCMDLLAKAGIYVIQDLSNPSSSINRNDPAWNTELFASYAAVVDTMQKYTNTLGFFAGNEVSNEQNNTAASAYVKAAVRDMKSYIKAKGYRTIGVGYATNDDASIRANLADYFNCGNVDDAIDFWGYNIYSWCGDSSFTESGYSDRTTEFKDYTVPVFFAEYGCNTPSPRKFTEVGAIYGSQMTDVWSGGIVYMYFQEANDYGLVTVSGNSASKLADFTALSSQLAKATPSPTDASAYTPSNTVVRSCPATGTAWAASSDLPPVANPDLCSCMVSSLGCAAASSISSDDIETQFAYVCGLNNGAFCDAINGNATTGVYGAYSVCTGVQKLSWAFDAYYKSQSSKSTACDFGGAAKIQSSSTSSSCKALLSQAGTAGTGTVTSAPSGTGGSTASSGTGSSASSTKSSLAGSLAIPRFDMGMLQLGAYVVVAGMAGAGMIIL